MDESILMYLPPEVLAYIDSIDLLNIVQVI